MIKGTKRPKMENKIKQKKLEDLRSNTLNENQENGPRSKEVLNQHKSTIFKKPESTEITEQNPKSKIAEARKPK